MALLWHMSADADIGQISALSERGVVPRDPHAEWTFTRPRTCFSTDQNWNAIETGMPATYAQSTARITSDALVPPKPKEFDNATLISRLRG